MIQEFEHGRVLYSVGCLHELSGWSTTRKTHVFVHRHTKNLIIKCREIFVLDVEAHQYKKLQCHSFWVPEAGKELCVCHK